MEKEIVMTLGDIKNQKTERKAERLRACKEKEYSLNSYHDD